RGRHPLWSADGRPIIYSDDQPSRNSSLWEVAFSDGQENGVEPPHALTIDRGRDLPSSASRDGRRVAYTVEEEPSQVEVGPFDAEAGRELGRFEAITSGDQKIDFWSFSPDGRSIVYSSHRGAGSTIWRADRGQLPAALTSDSRFND